MTEATVIHGGGLIADGPRGCVGRCICGWRSEHSDDNAPALKALVEHMTNPEGVSKAETP